MVGLEVAMIPPSSGGTDAVERVRASQRILVIGCPGAGKSTLRWELARQTGLPLIPLDDLYWGAGWRRATPAEFETAQGEVLRRRNGIIDGTFLRFLPQRLEWAEAVIHLDLPTCSALVGVLRRHLSRLLGDTVNLPRAVREAGVVEGRPLSRELLHFVLTFRSRVRPLLLGALRGWRTGIVLTLRTRAQVASFRRRGRGCR
jgi:hypothetical protein